MGSLGTPVLVLFFVLAAAATWIAGVYLSRTTDSLDTRFGLGEALGGLILLAVTGSLPEIAITASAALSGHLGLAVGNLIGGVAVQTLVLVVLDVVAGRQRPLSYLVGSLVPVLEALIVVVVLATALAGAALSQSTNIGGVSPTSIAVVVLWLGGVWVVNRVRLQPAWEVHAPESRPGRRHPREPHPAGMRPYAKSSTTKVLLIFLAGSAVTLGAGVVLQASGNILAGRMGLQGAIFGATFLAAATALPEISSGIAAVRLGDIQLAVGDILGGNSFQICLFLLADALAGTPVIVAAHTSDVWLGGLGLLMTGVAAAANRQTEALPPLARARLARAARHLRARDFAHTQRSLDPEGVRPAVAESSAATTGRHASSNPPEAHALAVHTREVARSIQRREQRQLTMHSLTRAPVDALSTERGSRTLSKRATKGCA